MSISHVICNFSFLLQLDNILVFTELGTFPVRLLFICAGLSHSARGFAYLARGYYLSALGYDNFVTMLNKITRTKL